MHGANNNFKRKSRHLTKSQHLIRFKKNEFNSEKIIFNTGDINSSLINQSIPLTKNDIFLIKKSKSVVRNSLSNELFFKKNTKIINKVIKENSSINDNNTNNKNIYQLDSSVSSGKSSTDEIINYDNINLDLFNSEYNNINQKFNEVNNNGLVNDDSVNDYQTLKILENKNKNFNKKNDQSFSDLNQKIIFNNNYNINFFHHLDENIQSPGLKNNLKNKDSTRNLNSNYNANKLDNHSNSYFNINEKQIHSNKLNYNNYINQCLFIQAIAINDFNYELNEKLIQFFKKTKNGMSLILFIQLFCEILINIKQNIEILDLGTFNIFFIEKDSEILSYNLINKLNKKQITITCIKFLDCKFLFYINDYTTTHSNSNENSNSPYLKKNQNNQNNETIELDSYSPQVNKSKPTLALSNYFRRGSSKLNNSINNVETNNIGNTPININVKTNNNVNNSIQKKYSEKLSALMHDFKHVITDNNIIFQELIKTISTKNDEENILDGKYMEIMTDYINFLIQNITDFLKDSENFFKSSIQTESIDLIDLIDTMIIIFNRRLKYHNKLSEERNKIFKKIIKIYHKVDRNNNKLRKVITNKNSFMSLIYNLLSNSFKETDEGEIYIETELINNKLIIINVVDTGPGMPESILKNWGKPFNNSNKKLNLMNVRDISDNKNYSMGLGQFIIATIKDNLKLDIGLPETNPSGKGTLIKIIMPLNINISTDNDYSNKSNYLQHSISTKRNNSFLPIIIEDKEKNKFYDSNNSSYCKMNSFFNFKTYNYIKDKVFYILCLDDDQNYLLSFINKVENEIKINQNGFKFEFYYSKNIKQFFDIFSTLLTNGKIIDFFIFDYYLSPDLKGSDCAKIVKKIYEIYFSEKFEKLFFNFIFSTEDAETLKNDLKKYNLKNNNNNNKYYKEDNIFGKFQYKEIKNKILELIEKEI